MKNKVAVKIPKIENPFNKNLYQYEYSELAMYLDEVEFWLQNNHSTFIKEYKNQQKIFDKYPKVRDAIEYGVYDKLNQDEVKILCEIYDSKLNMSSIVKRYMFFKGLDEAISIKKDLLNFKIKKDI